jgi:hypothetical protein
MYTDWRTISPGSLFPLRPFFTNAIGRNWLEMRQAFPTENANQMPSLHPLRSQSERKQANKKRARRIRVPSILENQRNALIAGKHSLPP